MPPRKALLRRCRPLLIDRLAKHALSMHYALMQCMLYAVLVQYSSELSPPFPSLSVFVVCTLFELQVRTDSTELVLAGLV